MRFLVFRTAVADAVWFRSYYAAVFPEGAKSAAESYRTARRLILANPHIGKPTEFMPSIREFRIPRTPFSFIYDMMGADIRVLRIMDARAERPPGVGGA
jgi:plasmid stabilization system protein ParE